MHQRNCETCPSKVNYPYEGYSHTFLQHYLKHYQKHGRNVSCMSVTCHRPLDSNRQHHGNRSETKSVSIPGNLHYKGPSVVDTLLYSKLPDADTLLLHLCCHPVDDLNPNDCGMLLTCVCHVPTISLAAFRTTFQASVAAPDYGHTYIKIYTGLQF